MIILNILLLLGVVVSYYGITKWHSKIIEAEKQLAEEKAKVSSIEALRNTLDDTKEDREYLSRLFVDKETAVDFLDFVESIGSISKADVSVDSVSPLESETAGSFVSVRFTAEGTWEEISSTLGLADHIPKALTVSSVQIIKDEDEVAPPPVAGEGGEKVKTPAPKPSIWRASFDMKVLKTPSIQ